MLISFLGHSCFKLIGKKVTVVTDPYDKTVSGELMPKIKADIVTISNFRHQRGTTERVTGSPFIIKGPGEYEIKGVFIFGFPLGENTAYIYRMDDLKICHLGELSSQLSDKQIEELSGVDVLIIPVSEVKKAVATVEQIEPRMVIPINSPEEFFQEIGREKIKPVKKLNVSPSSLPEEREVVWLKK